MTGHDFLLVVQHVDAQLAVALKYRVHRAVGVIQTITDGGVSVTEQTAVAVMPQRPASPAVVVTER